MSTPVTLPEGQVADAESGNWVDRYAPVWSRPYLRLSRADRPSPVWLLVLPCWWGLFLAIAATDASILDGLWIAVGCVIGALLMRGAGCTWNDFTDRELDAHVSRTASRPLPSGQVTPRAALIWMVLQSLLAFVVLITFPRAAIVLGLASLVIVAIYPFAKRFTWWPQAFLGLAFNWGALLGWAAVTGGLSWTALWLYLAGICWTIFYDTIYAHQDREDDALIGVKSTARLFGAHTKKWLALFGAASVAFLIAAVAGALSAVGGLSLILALSGPIAFAAHLSWQWHQLDINRPELCLKLFRSNRFSGFAVALAFAVAALL